jgi:GYF domain 2
MVQAGTEAFMSASWILNVGGRAYGPYTDAQMQSFAAEGRIAAQSLVARAGETVYRMAGEDPVLAPLFAPSKPATQAIAETMRPAEPAAVNAFGRIDDSTQTGGPSHVVIIADMKSRSIDGLEEEIYKLGPAYAFLPQAWLLSSDMTVNAIRNILVQQLGKLDTLFVVDATHDKAAWFNFGPEADTRIRRNWARALTAAPVRSATG